MATYQVTMSGDGSPDCAGIYVDAGEVDGYHYYTCVKESGTWFLTFVENRWYVAKDVNADGQINAQDLESPHFRGALSVTDPVQTYTAGAGATGTAIVSAYVAPVTNPRLSGSLSLVISHVNGQDLNPPKRLSMEFDL